MHTFVPAVLLGVCRFDALDGDPQTQPPHGQFAQAEESAGAGEGHTVVAADGARQAVVLEGSLKDTEGEVLAGALQAFAAQQVARGEVRDGQGITVAMIGEHELTLVIGTPQIIGLIRSGQAGSFSLEVMAGRPRLTRPCRSSTACTVLMAGRLTPRPRRLIFSRIFGAPQLG